jgi:hypothetical protein
MGLLWFLLGYTPSSGAYCIVMGSLPVSEFFSHQLGLLARVPLAFFFVAVPVGAAIWDYYGFPVCRDGLYFFLG